MKMSTVDRIFKTGHKTKGDLEFFHALSMQDGELALQIATVPGAERMVNRKLFKELLFGFGLLRKDVMMGRTYFDFEDPMYGYKAGTLMYFRTLDLVYEFYCIIMDRIEDDEKRMDRIEDDEKRNG